MNRSTVTGTLLLGVSCAYVLFLVGVEILAVLTGDSTISQRVQEWAQANVQLAVGLGVLAGWLIAHFSGPVGDSVRVRSQR